MKGLSFDQFSRAWRLMIGTGIVVYATLAPVSTGALPYVLVAGVGLMGLSITWPWERKQESEKQGGGP